jgi:hypothetical protein
MVKRSVGAVIAAFFLFQVCAGLYAQQTQNPAEPPQTPQASPEPTLPAPVEKPSIPLFELFGGYSYFSADPYTVNSRTGLNGFDVGLGINATRWLDILADLQVNYGSVNIPVLFPDPFPPCTPLCPSSSTTFPVHTHTITYLFGANFPYRRWDKFIPFGQFLVGRSNVNGTAYGIGNPTGTTEQDTRLAYAFGAGFDYTITEHLGWRTTGDYVPTRFFAHNQDNWRVSTGIVWHISRRKKKRTLTTP